MAVVDDNTRIGFNKMVILISLLVLVAASTFLTAKTSQQGSGIMIKGLTLGENIGREFPALTEQEWKPLKGGVIFTGVGRTDYKQYIRFAGGTTTDPIESGDVVYEENNENKVGAFLKFDDGDDIFEYEIQFQSGLQSRVSDGELIDLDGEHIKLLGSDFVITDARIDTTKNTINLKLLGGGKSLLLREGATDVFEVGTQRFVVSLMGVYDESRSPRAVIRFNNMQSDALEEGEIDYLPDGTAIGVVEILSNEAAEEVGGQDLVEFTLGASRVEFQDTYNDQSFENRVKTNGQNIPEGRIKIIGTSIGDKFKISSIIYRLEARGKRGGDVYVGMGSSLSSQIAEPGGLLTYDFDIFFGGLEETISRATKPRGLSQVGGGIPIIFRGRDDRYTWQFTNVRGQTYNIPIAYNSQSTGFRAGDKNGELFFKESTSDTNFIINTRDMVVVTNKNTDIGSTNVLRYVGINPTDKSVQWEDFALGRRQIQLRDDPNPAILGRAELIASGVTYEFTVSATAPYPIAIDLTSDNDFDGDSADVIIFGGGRFDVNVGGAGIDFTLITDDRKIDDSNTDEEVEFGIIATAGDEVDMDFPLSQNSLTLQTLTKGRRVGMSNQYGVLFAYLDKGSGDANDLSIDYPTRQRAASVGVTS